MKATLPNLPWVGCCLAATLACTAWGEAESPRLALRETWHTQFGGTQTVFHAEIAASNAFRGQLQWSLTLANRAVARGAAAVVLESGGATSGDIPLTMPDIKEGLVSPVTLTVDLVADGSQTPAAHLERALWIFAADPFTDRQAWLKTLDIRLFDPERHTAEIFEQMRIPFTPLHTADAIAELRAGLLVVGEGASFQDYRALGALLVEAAARGLPVLCLAPSGGAFALPGANPTETPNPRALILKRAAVIRELDKRLDAQTWRDDFPATRRTLTLKPQQERILAECGDSTDGWPWLEAPFEKAPGRLIVCGFDLIARWESGPTPRYLLARIFEHLTTDKKESGSQHSE